MKLILRLVIFTLIVWAVPFVSVVHAQDDVFAPYRERGIVVAQESGMAPMSFREVNGRPKGYIIDLWRKWSAETGVPVTFHLTDWADTLTSVQDGVADVHGGLFYTAERDTYLDYTLPFFPSKGGFFVTSDSQLTNMAQMRGKSVGVIEKSFYDTLIRTQYPDIIPVPIRTAPGLIEAALSGTIDGFLADYPTLMYQASSMGKLNEFKVVEFISLQEFRAAVAKGNYQLLAMVEAGLARIDQDERNGIFNRWVIGEDYQSDKWMLPIVIVSFIALLLAALLPVVFGRRRT